MAVVALMAAVLSLLAPFSVPIGPIPISMATFGIYLTIFLLGQKKSTWVCSLYLLIGLIGIPVFSGFTGGAARLFGPTGGYLAGYLLLTTIAGWFVDKYPQKKSFCLLGFIFGTAACYLLGTVWLAYYLQITFFAAFLMGVMPFLFGDVLKMFAALWIGGKVRGQLKRAGVLK